MLSEDLTLPLLRDDIQLNEAPIEPEGSPSWTLYDPTANKYYKIGWFEFECLARFKDCQSVNQLVDKVKRETALQPDGETVNALVQFLVMHNLVQTTTQEALDYFEERRQVTQLSWWQRLLHSYLFFTLPLFKPEVFLKKTYPLVKPIFSRPFMIGVLMLLGYGIFLSLQRFDEVANTFVNYLNLEGVILFVGATIIVKIIHELGHAYTATKYGVPVTVIGLAFIVLYPILYTETTNAWKLKSRSKRLVIAAGGMMAELTLAAVTLLLWHVLSPGMAQSLCFMIAIVSMLASLLVNLNPLMKFDGYYLFSDLVGVDNLQDRSFAYLKWKIREVLWGWGDDVPEITSASRQNLFIGFGLAICIYRFFLYLGISLLVYHLFFQPLGLILMIVELAFFIVVPILREVKIWVGRSSDIFETLRGKISLLIIFLILLMGFVPIRNNVEVNVVLHAENYARFYAPVPAKIEEIAVFQGQKVTQGDLLFRLSSFNLDHNINITRQRLEDLIAIRNSSQATPELANKRSMINSEIENTRQELAGFQEMAGKLNIRAPFSGTIEMLEPSLSRGQSVSTTETLALLADNDHKILSGYIGEQDAGKIPLEGAGTFYPEYSPFVTYPVVLERIDKTGADVLFWSELSSEQGGAIPSKTTQGGRIEPLPQYTVYPIYFKLMEEGQDKAFPSFVARGTVIITGERKILVQSLIKKGASIFIMDSGL